MKAMYAFSGDPITYGHIDIIKRAHAIFKNVVVGIGVNPDKKYTFTLEERLSMAKESLKDLKGVEVIAFSGLLYDYAYENNIDVILRGIRNNADMEYEYTFQEAGRSQKLDIETFLMFAKPEYKHISSSTVKALIKEQGDIKSFVPVNVKRRLEDKILNQKIISITGTIGAGKSYVTEKLVNIGRELNEDIYNIDLDVITHEILSTLKEPIYLEIRNDLISRFGERIKNEDGSINRKELGEIVFNDSESLLYLNNLMTPALNERIRREMYGKKGIILINAALLIENGYYKLSNYNGVLITVSEEVQKKRLALRGLSDKQINSRIKSQYSTYEKRELALKQIKENKYGKLIEFDTSNENDDDIRCLYEKIKKLAQD